MSLLYKLNPKLFVEIKQIDDKVELYFTSDGGKFGTIENIDSYKLTPERLLEILQKNNDYKDEEL